ncbi:bifunctional 5-dehydro-2-deoxygluconokinase/5-dehydro-2-deoxyphosphogluconate aldolase [Salinisphaera hydrothermalis]|uniref:IolC protein n=1 Tax=Salinisphaera hydrothermalis (strain C41B8) TaxID=1304275 RepID=A0A084IMJ1_SALHC|nr:5-dehydro-2-deoxygluconokinase [Salinisphaera hydrothermalis]KEZ77925.1 IolC protein [Salinisphaera hydrothermalis C41B8]
MSDNALDLICLGRAAVDLYAQQIGSRLEDVSSFAKYLGGSSGNCAYGSARLGLKSAMLTRVGNEQFGNFVVEEFQRAGVDTSHMPVDKERFTALAILAIKDRDTFPLLFYRKDCADMAIAAEDVDPDWIGTARALAITGTHLSTETTQGACRAALDAAKQHGLKRILDIDYRPVLWGLAELGDGETRYVDDAETTAHLQRWIGDFDLIVGTEEEFHIAGGTTDTIAALKKVRELSDAVLVCKLGALGCTIFEGPVGDTVHDGVLVEGVKVEVLNVLGAGDAFISGFLRGYLRGESWETCATYANACGALVVSRHGCAPAMPTEAELFDYLARRDDVPRPDRDDRLNDLHAKTTRHPAEWGPIYGLAFDHRLQLFDMVGELGVDAARLSPLKELLVAAAEKGLDKAGVPGTPAVLCDDVIGQDALNAMTGRGWWIGRPVEEPGSRPLRFQHGDDIGSQLISWPAEHIIKCLVFYHPDDEIGLRLDQEDKLRQLDEARRITGHELLIEVIPPKDRAADDATVARSLQRFYHLGIRPDWWKLPPMSAAAWRAVRGVIERHDDHCRGVVLLGLDAPMGDVKAGFRDASASEICRGFTIGRTLFAGPAREWLAGELGDDAFVAAVSDNYAELITTWRDAVGETDNPRSAGAMA